MISSLKCVAICCVIIFVNITRLFAAPKTHLKIHNKHYINIPEPSDVCLAANKSSLFIVSDQGLLYQTDLQGKVLKQSTLTGDDFEAVYADDNFVYVVDESDRKLYKVDATTLTLSKTIDIPYKGELNEGAEGISYNTSNNHFYIVTEKNPILIREFDVNFNLISETKFKDASDVSSMQFYNNQLYFLSDEDHCILKLDDTYKVIQKWNFNIPNPEGFCFDKDGNIIILSDEMEAIFFINKPE